MANPHLYDEGHDIGVDRRFLVNMGGREGGRGRRLRGATTEEIADFQERNGPLHGRDSNRRPSGKRGETVLSTRWDSNRGLSHHTLTF